MLTENLREYRKKVKSNRKRKKKIMQLISVKTV